MSDLQDAVQTKIKFIRYEENDSTQLDKDYNRLNDAKNVYTAQINPSSINHIKSISYGENLSLNRIMSIGDFNGVDPEKLTLDLLFDGTGAAGMLNIVDDVATEIINLENVIYRYIGGKHETPFVGIIWGNIKFFGRLLSLDYKHTMFKPSGKPLRTRVTMVFTSSMSIEMQAKKAKRSSPDLSHLVTVKAGDTLPSMCQRIYSSSHYYLQVAKINKLTDFRSLVPGTKLLFPPIKK